MLRFFILFVVLLVSLFALRSTQFAATHVTVPFTEILAAISAALVTAFDPDVISQGVILRSQSNGFAVQIAPGCDGIEAVIILVSAVLAFPAPWRHRLAGIGVGFIAIQALNLVRIISLFYLGQWDRVWFDWFHLYLWQALIVLDALAVWLIWLRWLPKPERFSRPPSAAPVSSATP